MINVILCILSLIGYYFIFKRYIILSYFIFIIQNIIALYVYHSFYMLINVFACLVLLSIIASKPEKNTRAEN